MSKSERFLRMERSTKDNAPFSEVRRRLGVPVETVSHDFLPIVEDDEAPEILPSHEDDDLIADIAENSESFDWEDDEDFEQPPPEEQKYLHPFENLQRGENLQENFKPQDKWTESWKVLGDACSKKGISPYAVFAEHISDINRDVYGQFSVLIRRLIYLLSPEEIMELTKHVISLPKVQEKLDFSPKSDSDRGSDVDFSPKSDSGHRSEGDFSPKSDSAEVDPTSKSEEKSERQERAMIHLKKGLDRTQINEFIIRIDANLREVLFEDVNVITNDWEKSGEFFPLIPAAKKLFSKYVDAGLLGCLLSRGYIETAKKVYCIAYCKGKKKDETVVFSGVHAEDYKNKCEKSFAAYSSLMKSVKLSTRI